MGRLLIITMPEPCLPEISNSRFNLMLRCPGQYYFQYIIKSEEKETVWPRTVFGLIVHDLMEQFFLQFNQDKEFAELSVASPDKIKTWFPIDFNARIDQKIEELKNESGKIFKRSKEYRKKTYVKLGEQWTYKFLLFLLRNIDFDNWTVTPEKKIQCVTDRVIFTGIIDLLLEHKTEQRIQIHDFKNTGYNNKWHVLDWHKRDTQSHFYLWAVYQSYSLIPESFSYIVMNPWERTFIVQTNETKKTGDRLDAWVNKRVDFFLDAAKNSVNSATWKPSRKECFFCRFKKICPKAIH